MTTQRDKAIADAARSLVRNKKDGLDIVAMSDWDELVRLVEGEKGEEQWRKRRGKR